MTEGSEVQRTSRHEDQLLQLRDAFSIMLVFVVSAKNKSLEIDSDEKRVKARQARKAGPAPPVLWWSKFTLVDLSVDLPTPFACDFPSSFGQTEDKRSGKQSTYIASSNHVISRERTVIDLDSDADKGFVNIDELLSNISIRYSKRM